MKQNHREYRDGAIEKYLCFLLIIGSLVVQLVSSQLVRSPQACTLQYVLFRLYVDLEESSNMFDVSETISKRLKTTHGYSH